MEVSLPEEKLVLLRKVLLEFMHKRVATKLELQQLSGVLGHCSTVVRGGRTFSRRVINLTNSVRESYHRVRLNEEFRADLRWWVAFASLFNGKAKILCPRSPSTVISCDSSSRGFGAYHQGDWLYGVWLYKYIPGLPYYPDHFFPVPTHDDLTHDNNIQELWPVLMALVRWGPRYRDSTVLILSDNTQVCRMLFTGRSRNNVSMDLLRELFWLCFTYNINIVCSYIRSGDNCEADYVSRLAYPQVAAILPPFPLCCRTVAAAAGSTVPAGACAG